jgi:tetratricopeptide (TPR) repeat protein
VADRPVGAEANEGATEPLGPNSLEEAYRRADEGGDAGAAFNLGVLLHARRDIAGAVAAYERAERRGDVDAAFNLGVLLYETGDLDGAESAWRRCAVRGHAQAAANLGFLLARRGEPGAHEAVHPDASELGDHALKTQDDERVSSRDRTAT